jgi:aryl-alcohol dehydrogenase
MEDLELGEIRPDEVLIRIAGTGLCHTDLVVRDQMLPVPLPAVLGHEGAGIVEAIGAEVKNLQVGDRVVLGFAACRACATCCAGAPAYCQHFAALNFGGSRADGSTCLHDDTGAIASHFFGQSSFGSHAIASARNVVKVSAAAPLELLGPLGCGIMTGAGAVFNALNVVAGEAVLVTGAGPVGLSAVMAAKVRAAGMIIVSDPLLSRREMALELGATHVLDPAGASLSEQVRALLPSGVQCVLDTSGVEDVIEAGVSTLGAMGRLAMVGVPRSTEASVSLNILHLLSLGIQVHGVTEGNADPQMLVPELIDLFVAGKFPFDRLIRTYPLSQINQAVEDQLAGRCVKAVLQM